MTSSPTLQPKASLVPPVRTLGSGSPQPRDVQESPVTVHDVKLVMDICARVEAESMVRHRMVLRSLKSRRNQSGNLFRTFDIEADLENSLNLVECLPQEWLFETLSRYRWEGSRGAHPPREEFLQLSREIMGTSASPRTILENALLFEEYALQLLCENDPHYESQYNRGTISPWLLLSDVEHRVPAESLVALPWPDKWLARRMRRLLGAAQSPVQQEGVITTSDQSELQETRRRGRPRKRRRKEATFSDSDGMPKRKQDGSDSYSSDNYSDTSEEEADNAVMNG